MDWLKILLRAEVSKITIRNYSPEIHVNESAKFWTRLRAGTDTHNLRNFRSGFRESGCRLPGTSWSPDQLHAGPAPATFPTVVYVNALLSKLVVTTLRRCFYYVMYGNFTTSLLPLGLRPSPSSWLLPLFAGPSSTLSSPSPSSP